MTFFYYVFALLFICIAHMIRIIRWELFIGVYEKPRRDKLIQAMSYGYLLNYFLPFKMGELVRAWYAGRRMKNGRALGFSTVVIDRYLDIVAVGIIFILLSVFKVGNHRLEKMALAYTCVSFALLLIAITIYVLRSKIKRIIRNIASIFNERIESSILRFAWALIWNFKDIFQKISKPKLIISTVGMWLGYLISYYLFAYFLRKTGTDASWVDIFLMLFAQNGIKGSTGGVTLLGNDTITTHPVFVVAYMVLPTLILLSLSVFMKKEAETGNDSENNYLRLLPHMDAKERLDFLEAYFSNQNRLYIDNYIKINQEISIIRDYSAGSNATTMLCMDGKKTFFRKYAFGADGEKLYQQICWIESNRGNLALPEIMRQEKSDMYCYYDMPYVSGSVGLFEYAHSMPIERTWHIIQSALECLENSIYRNNRGISDRNTIHKYIETKVIKNLNIIKNAKKMKNLQQFDRVIINGVEYNNLPYFEKYLQEEFLQKIFEKDCYSTIHGDLTIENIICVRDDLGNDDFYIIDPNTGNVHDSPNLDYAKLLQSIHGGYEFLMSTKDVKVEANRINFLFTRSSVYMELHDSLKSYMLEKFGKEKTRSIYFHEIIHWLRLMPYKIEKDEKRAMLFYAGMIMVMNDVIEMYGKDIEC